MNTNHIEKLIKQRRYIDASSYAIYKNLTYEARELFSKDILKTHEHDYRAAKKDAFEELLLADAKEDFDVYNRFLDYRQPLPRNFSLDRRKYLKDINDTITNMFFPKKDVVSYDVIRIKLITRTGKSEIFNRAAFWVQGNFGHGETLHVVGGGRLKDSIHAKRKSFIDEYWHRHLMVFPDSVVVKESKMDAGVWLSNKEYADIATVTVGGSIEGYVQVSNLLILDDLLSSNEINSVKRLTEIYEVDILNSITRRISGKPKKVLIGTPIPTQTGIPDPLDRYYDDHVNGGYNCKEFIIPALNENNESNYAYRKFEDNKKYSWEFTTDEFLRRKKIAYAEPINEARVATFETIFQMKPVQFGARTFGTMHTFTSVPTGNYKEINILDPADAGDDSAVLVHGRVYDSQPHYLYVYDVFKDTRPMVRGKNNGYLDDLVAFMMKNNIHNFTYESNMGGNILGDTLKDIAKENNYQLSYEQFKQTKNKLERIRDNAVATIDIVRLWDVSPTTMYEEAKVELLTWNEHAKHDDFTDALTKCIEKFTEGFTKRKNKFMRLNKPIM